MEKSETKKKKAEEKDKTTPVFRFFLSNGQEIKTLEGLVVPVTEKTKLVYRMLAEDDSSF